MTDTTNTEPAEIAELLSFDESGVQFAWDATSVSNFAKCPRYYKFVNIEGWQPREKSVHLLFGGWYAKALEEYFILTSAGISPEDALCEIITRVLFWTWVYPEDADLDAAPFGDQTPLRGEPGPWESLHNAKTRETLVRSIIWYFEEFGEDDPTEVVHLSDGSPAVELSFAIPLDDEIVYCGHIDRLVKFGEEVYAMDQKTSGTTITPRFFTQFSPDYQMSGYTFAGNIMFENPVSGVIIDAAQIAVGFTAFTRGFVQKPPALLAEWREDLINTIEDARDKTRRGKFTPNFTACDKYGGCSFRKICARAPEHRAAALSQDFVRKPRWDPLKQR